MKSPLNATSVGFLGEKWNKPLELPVLNLMWWGLHCAWPRMGIDDDARSDLMQIVMNLGQTEPRTATEYLARLQPPGRSGVTTSLAEALKQAASAEEAAALLLGELQRRRSSAASLSA